MFLSRSQFNTLHQDGKSTLSKHHLLSFYTHLSLPQLFTRLNAANPNIPFYEFRRLLQSIGAGCSIVRDHRQNEWVRILGFANWFHCTSANKKAKGAFWVLLSYVSQVCRTFEKLFCRAILKIVICQRVGFCWWIFKFNALNQGDLPGIGCRQVHLSIFWISKIGSLRSL